MTGRTEMGIYRDHCFIGDKLLSFTIILIYRLPLSLLQCILLSQVTYRDKRLFMHPEFKVGVLALWKKCNVQKILLQFGKISILFGATAEHVNCSLLKFLEKSFCNLTYKKKFFVKHFENLLQHLSEKFIGDNSSIADKRRYRVKKLKIYRYRFCRKVQPIVPTTEEQAGEFT